jgi:hypothetical protein
LRVVRRLGASNRDRENGYKRSNPNKERRSRFHTLTPDAMSGLLSILDAEQMVFVQILLDRYRDLALSQFISG